MATPDEIGDRSQWIAFLRLTAQGDQGKPYFRPHFLGDKCPTFDFFVEVVTAEPPVPCFFIQVKGTRQGCSVGKQPGRIKVKIPEGDVRQMALHPAPTYVIGVDEVNERAYLLGIVGTQAGAIATVPTRHPLEGANLSLLRDEVIDYWKDHDPKRKRSRFGFEGNDHGGEEEGARRLS
jgi:hypothetical protein